MLTASGAGAGPVRMPERSRPSGVSRPRSALAARQNRQRKGCPVPDIQPEAFPRFAACGDRALAVEFSDRVDETVNETVLALARALEDGPPDGLDEIVPTYRSLLVFYDPVRTGHGELAEAIRTRLDSLPRIERAGGEVSIPVHYGGEACLDLEEMAASKGMDREEVIAQHLSGDYRVYMIGFAPGFAYLGGLPDALHTPRKPAPRQRVPEGAVGIGGAQACVNSVASPSAWHFIGQTPLKLFDPHRERPFLLSAGDRVRFRRVGADEFADIEERIANGDTGLERDG